MLRFFLILLTAVSIHAQDHVNAYDTVMRLSADKIVYTEGDSSAAFFEQQATLNYIDLFLHLKTASYDDYFQRSKAAMYKDQHYGIKQTLMLLDYAQTISSREPEKMADIYITLLRYAKNAESNAYGMLDFIYAISIYDRLLPAVNSALMDERLSSEVQTTIKSAIEEYAPTDSAAINRIWSHEAEYVDQEVASHKGGDGPKFEQYLLDHYNHAIRQAIQEEYAFIQKAIANDSLEELKQYSTVNEAFSDHILYYTVTASYASVVGSLIEILGLEEHVEVELYTYERLIAKTIAVISSPQSSDLWLRHKALVEEYKVIVEQH